MQSAPKMYYFDFTFGKQSLIYYEMWSVILVTKFLMMLLMLTFMFTVILKVTITVAVC